MKKFSVWFPLAIALGILGWGIYWTKGAPEYSSTTVLGAIVGIVICVVVAIMNFGKSK